MRLVTTVTRQTIQLVAGMTCRKTSPVHGLALSPVPLPVATAVVVVFSVVAWGTVSQVGALVGGRGGGSGYVEGSAAAVESLVVADALCRG